MEYWVTVEPNVRVYVNDINPQGKSPILFLHGWPANYNMFEYQYQDFIRQGIRCIGMDMRGFGRSDKPVRGYSYNRLAEDVRAVITALKLRGLTLAGHSTGGAVALRYAARYRVGVSKLALCAAAAPSLIQRPGFPHGQTEADILTIIENTYADRPNMLHGFGEIFFNQKVTPSFSDWFFQLGLEAAPWSTVAVSRTWIEEVLFDDLPKVHIPTLILHGVNDRVCYYPLALALHEGIAGSTLIPFEKAGHGLFYDEKEKFNKELAAFAKS